MCGGAAGARHTGAVPTTLEPTEVMEPDLDDAVAVDRPWVVLVWNDPVNLMSYVTYVFQKLFGYSLEKATELMLDVHEKGRAVVPGWPWWPLVEVMKLMPPRFTKYFA